MLQEYIGLALWHHYKANGSTEIVHYIVYPFPLYLQVLHLIVIIFKEQTMKADLLS